MNDSDIIKGILGGSAESERILFEKYDQKIRFIVYSRLSNYKSYAPDVIQDIKISVLTSIRNGHFRFENELSMGAYIYGIALKKISDFIRRNSRNILMPEANNRNPGKIYFDSYDIEDTEMKNIIKRALKNLKQKYQEVLLLKFFEELSVKEISEQLMLPPRRVSERINYALKLIKKELEKTGYFA